MKTFAVDIIETRIIQVLVKAENEEDAFDKAETLHECNETICEMLNDPSTCTDAQINVIEETTPNKNEKVFEVK